MYGDDIWWFNFYDMDSSLGLDNTGYKKFDSNIEPSQPNVYNCSTSRMWIKLNDWCKDELFNTFKALREGGYTYENVCKYLIEDQIDVIPQILYNKDMYQKYISQGRQYLHMLHGNNKDHLLRWLYNRFQYVDSLFLQHNSPYTKKSITIRSCKPTWIPEDQRYTARFEIQTYSPQYITVCWRKNTYETKRVNWGETVVFENEMVNSQDNEIIVYCAGNLKYIGNCSNLNPTSVDIGNATRLLEFVCEDSNQLVKADLSKNTYLRRASFKNCSVLGTASGGSNVIDVSNCTNLKEIDLRGTQITSLLTNINGGNLEKILYPTSIQNVVVSNQINLKVLGLPIGDDIAPNLTNVQILDCNNIETLKYPYDEANPVIDFESIKYVQNLTLDNSLGLETINFKGFNKLKNLVIRNMLGMSSIGFDDMLSKDDVATLEKITLTNIPLIKALTFNVTSDDYAIKFVDGAVIDVRGLTSLSSIESNYTIQGLDKLIIPITTERLIFRKEFGAGDSNLSKIYSSSCVADETENCVNVLDCKIRQLMLENLVNRDVKNLYYAPITDEDKLVTVPYITNAIGTIDVSEFIGTVEDLFNGLDIVTKLNVINSKGITMPQTDLYRLFRGAILNNEVVNKIIKWFKNVVSYKEMFIDNTYVTELDMSSWNTSYVTNWNGTFKGCANLTTPPTFPAVVEDISNVLYGCSKITTITIPLTIISYNNALYGCVGITDIDWTGERTTDFSLTDLGCPVYTENDIHELVNENLAEVERAILTVDKTYGSYLSEEEVFTANNKGWSIKDINDDFIIVPSDLDVSTLATNTKTTKAYIELTNDNYTTRVDEVLAYYPNCTDLYLFEDGSVTSLANFLLNSTTKSQIVKVIFLNGYFNGVTNLSHAFSGSTNLNCQFNFSTLNLDTDALNSTFKDCSSLTYTPILPSSYAGSMESCFQGCSSLITIDLSSLNKDNITNINNVFNGCTSLVTVDISNWNTSNLVEKTDVFTGCTNLTNLTMDSWNITDLSMLNFLPTLADTQVSHISMKNYTFGDLTSFNIQIDEETDIVQHSYHYYPFRYTHQSYNNETEEFNSEEIYYLPSNIISIDLTGWNTSNVTNMSHMFYYCEKLTTIDLSSWNTSNVTDMSVMFANCTSLTTLDLSSFDTSKVTDMGDMFSDSTSLTDIIGIENLNMSSVEYMSSMFSNCSSLTDIDLSNCQISKLSGCSSIFSGCTSLSSVNMSNVGTTGQYNALYLLDSLTSSPVTEVYMNNWDLSTITSTNSLLNGCQYTGKVYMSNWNLESSTTLFSAFRDVKITEIVADNWNVPNVTTVSQLCANGSSSSATSGCPPTIQRLSMANWNTTSLTNVRSMFYNLYGGKNNTTHIYDSITYLNIKGWDLSHVTDFGWMFCKCTNLDFTDVDVASFNVSSGTIFASMFYGCTLLQDDIVFPTCAINVSHAFRNSGVVNVHSNWNTTYTNTITTSYCYSGCEKIKTIDGEPGSIKFIPTAWGGLGFTKDTTSIFTIDTTLWDNLTLDLTKDSFYDIKYPSPTAVDWGDGTVDTNTSHTYAEHGIYEITMKGVFQGYSMYRKNGFKNPPVTKVTQIATKYQNGSTIYTITSLNSTFTYCSYLTDISNLSKLDTSKIRSMRGVFYSCSSLTDIKALSNWDVSNVTNLGDGSGGVVNMGMFADCTNLTDISPISNWNVSSVTDMATLFSGCNKLENLSPISNWNMNNVTNMKGMFGGCKLTNVNLSLNPNKYINLESVFSNCKNLIDFDFGCTVKTKNIYKMFYGIQATDEQLKTWVDKLNLDEVKNINCYGGNSLATVEIVKYILNKPTTPITNFSYLFSEISITSLAGLEDLDTSSVTDMNRMFYNCKNLTDISAISNWDTSNVADIHDMFYYCTSLTDVSAIRNWNVSSVTNMSYMFYDCTSLTTIDLSNWNTSKVTNMYGMFYDCGELSSLNITGWDTSKVTNMSYMFYDCYKLTTIDLSGWNTGSVTNMYDMFGYCYSLTTLNMTGCNVSNVTNFGSFLNMGYGNNTKFQNFTAPSNISVSFSLKYGYSSYFYCNGLTHDSLMSIINNLAEVTTAQTLTLGTTNLNKLTDDEKAIATNKGWTLA